MTTYHIERPEPRVTNQIEFLPIPLPPPPSLTCHIEFTSERLRVVDPDDTRTPPDDTMSTDRNQGPRRDAPSPSGSEQQGGANPARGLPAESAGSASRQSPTQARGAQRATSPDTPPLRNNLIPKPPGEPGRPGSGGYSLEDTLIKTHNWSKEAFDKLSEAVRSAARRKLDMTVSFRSQDKEAVHAICDKMASESEDHWPKLASYEECWPVRSILKLALKYAAEASRRASAKERNTRLSRALRGLSPDQ